MRGNQLTERIRPPPSLTPTPFRPPLRHAQPLTDEQTDCPKNHLC